MTNIVYIVKGDTLFWDYQVISVHKTEEQAIQEVNKLVATLSNEEIEEANSEVQLDNAGLVIEKFQLK